MEVRLDISSKCLLECIVTKLLERKECEIFLDPVPYVELGLNDYLNVVKYPMDLTQVMKKLQSNSYCNIQCCAADIRQIFHNAKVYNAIGSPIFNIAVEMNAYFESLFCKMNVENACPSHDQLFSWAVSCRK